MGHSLTGRHCFLLLGWQMMILDVFITLRVKYQLLKLEAPTFKSLLTGSLRRDAAGNRIWKLSLGFLSECVGVDMFMGSFSFLLM